MNSDDSNSVPPYEEEALFGTDTNTKQPYGETKKEKTFWLLQRFHILSWITSYDRTKAISDLIAGLTLGMTIIPQSIAYASLAGVSSQYGLYSSFVGSFAYVIFGTIPQVSIGPTSLMALLTLQYTMGLPVEFVIILSFVAGIVELAMGVLNLGFILNFISRPVTSAFTTGTSTIVTFIQLKSMMGIKGNVRDIGVSNLLSQISLGDSILGFTIIATLLLLRQLSRLKFETTTPLRKFSKVALWYVSISRNAIVVLVSSFIAYALVNNNGTENMPFALSPKVNSTQISVQLPPFVISHGNETYNFLAICKELGSAIFVVPVVAILANVAIAKAFVKDTTLDASQEMFTLGMCNVVGAFFNAMPTCGAFTRSAVSQASGVKTPMSGVYTGVLVLLAIGILTPYFEYIPRSTLSAVLISAVIFMIDFKIVKKLWTRNRTDFFNWVGVFTVCIIGGVELGLLFGIVTNMLLIVFRLANPKIEANLINIKGENILYIAPCADIYYAGAECIREKIKSACALYNDKYSVAIECEKLMEYDYTSIFIVKSILKDMEEKSLSVYLLSPNLKASDITAHLKSHVVILSNFMELEKFILEKNYNGNKIN